MPGERASERADISIGALHRAIDEVVSPKAPPRLSKEGAAVGLSFLDTSLRQNHIRRVTDRIGCSEVSTASRLVEVDISLNLLDDGQWSASRAFDDLRMRYRDPGRIRKGHEFDLDIGIGWEGLEVEQAKVDSNMPFGKDEVDGTSFKLGQYSPFEASGHESSVVWVPVTRVPRRAVAPIDVRDSTGMRLPRLTQFESSRLLASGMYRLLRSILRSGRGSDSDEFLYRSYRSRWQVQAALITLFTEQNGPLEHYSFPYDSPDAVRPYRTATEQRENMLAHTVVEACAKTGYGELLSVALSEYLLVVALDASSDEHILVFDAPLAAKSSDSLRAKRSDKFVVRYEQTLPANLRAYHLLVHADDGVEIGEMVAVSNADFTIAGQLAEDLSALSKWECKSELDAGLDAYWRLEIAGCVDRLQELVRRRAWEAKAADGKFDASHCPQVMELLKEDHRDAEVAELRARLKAASDQLLSLDLALSLTVENDPRASTAHAYWRRVPSRAVLSGRFNLHGTVTLVDATRTNEQSVSVYALAVAAIAFSVALVVNAGASINVDAAVSILLLVPGFLYYRLNLPRRQSILGRLQVVPRTVAYVCLFSMVGLAIALLAGANSLILFSLSVIPLVGAAYLWGRRHGLGSSDPSTERKALEQSGIPSWYSQSEAAGSLRSGFRARLVQMISRIASRRNRDSTFVTGDEDPYDLVLRSEGGNRLLPIGSSTTAHMDE
jgi:hypothetical protein